MTDDNRAPWATLEDVRRIVREMIAGTRIVDRIDDNRETFCRLVPPPEPTDCPDSGPAKEAATASASAATTPTPQRWTATGALSSVEEEAKRIALRRAVMLERKDCEREILALVKRERDAAILDARAAFDAAHKIVQEDALRDARVARREALIEAHQAVHAEPDQDPPDGGLPFR